MRTALLGLLLAGCTTLTPQQQTGLAESKAFLATAARADNVWTPGLVVGPTAGEGGYYRGGTIFLSHTALTSRHREAILAHELAHYLLGHEPQLVFDRSAWLREANEKERQANIKSVEVLMRVKRISQAEAVQIVRRKLEAFVRGGAWAPGHKTPSEELADLLAAFPSTASD